MSRARLATALAAAGACWLAVVALSAQQQGAVSGGSEAISPSVIQNVFTHQEPDGSWRLDLLVLWRGAPGWFLAGGANGTKESSGTGRPTYLYNRHADVDFDVLLDARAGTARVAGTTIQLEEVNVVLVDGMPHRMKIVGTRMVNGRIERPPIGLQKIFRAFPELDNYLRCDVTRGDPVLEYLRAACTWGPGK